jgi:hypothetical protein
MVTTTAHKIFDTDRTGTRRSRDGHESGCLDRKTAPSLGSWLNAGRGDLK